MSTLDLKKMDIATLIPTIVEFGLPRFSENKVLVIGLKFEAKRPKEIPFCSHQITLFFYAPKHSIFVGVYQGELERIPGRLSLSYPSCNVSDWKFDIEYVVNDVFGKIMKRVEASCCNKFRWEYKVDFSSITPQVVNGLVEIIPETKFANFKKMP